jgi:hypothetical protein
VNDQDFAAAASAVIPILLLVLATEERLGIAKLEWLRTPRLHALARLLGSLVVGEMLALGSLRRDAVPYPVVAFLVVVIGAALALLAWGIGWSIWLRYSDLVPKEGTPGKQAFWVIGAVVVCAVALAGAWCLQIAGFAV